MAAGGDGQRCPWARAAAHARGALATVHVGERPPGPGARRLGADVGADGPAPLPRAGPPGRRLRADAALRAAGAAAGRALGWPPPVLGPRGLHPGRQRVRAIRIGALRAFCCCQRAGPPHPRSRRGAHVHELQGPLAGAGRCAVGLGRAGPKVVRGGARRQFLLRLSWPRETPGASQAARPGARRRRARLGLRSATGPGPLRGLPR
mmetsp:Transcript_28379/g.85564  ORF Transcript_28379/g.85564 Transcript_28379/m.85564 type:complete len:206 (-) Transcript_28379:707-1324(-)